MHLEVLIIGGGVIGLSIARSLFHKGISNITILERGKIGQESSFAAAGLLAPQSEADSVDDFFDLCSESRSLYPKFSADLKDETGIDIELDQSGTLYLAFTRSDVKLIRDRYEFQKTAGLKVEHLTAQQIKKTEPFVSPDVLEGLFFENDWQVENRSLLSALKRFAEINKIRIVENAEVNRLASVNGQIESAETSDAKYSADTVVLATGAWTSLIKTDGFRMPAVKPIKGQMVSFHTARRLFSKVIYSPRGYVVPRKFGKILAGATEEDIGFDKDVSPEGTEFVRTNAFEVAPGLSNLPIDETWAGLRPFSYGGLPVIGSFPQCGNLFIATSHYRNGILLAPLTAELVADRIANKKESKYLDTFGLKRFENSRELTAGGDK